jgi:hypothetical protein
MLATIFYRLLDARLLDAIDVCELAVTCRELSSCARRFWREASHSPGSQARRLLPPEPPGRRWVECEEALALRGFEGEDVPFRFSGAWGREVVLAAAPRGYACACCLGTKNPVHGFFFCAAPDVPALCRACYALAATERASLLSSCADPAAAADPNTATTPATPTTTTTPAAAKPPPPPRLSHYRLVPLRDLALGYWCDLPFSMFGVALRSLAPKTRGTKPLFVHESPHGSVRRVAALALLKKTPAQLKEHWRVLDGARRYYEAAGVVVPGAAAQAQAEPGAVVPFAPPTVADWGGYFAHEEF